MRPSSDEAPAAASTSLISPGQSVALCALALLAIGVIMVNSAGMSVDPTRAVTIESILLSKSTIYMGLAVAAMLIAALLPIRRFVARFIERPTPPPTESPSLVGHLLRLWPLWAFTALMLGVLASVYMPVIGKQVNNSHRWINLHVPGLDSIQPSEIAKWALILGIAWYGTRNARHMPRFFRGLIPGLAAAGAVAGFIVLEDLGTGALLGMVACLLLIAAGARIWHLLILAPIPLAALTAAIITSPYRVERILAFLNPYEDPQGIGYHMIQSMVAVANGQFFGTGVGHGLQKFGYLPEDTTDFLFAIICEELGVFGAALVIFLYGAMLWSILQIIRREPSRFLKLTALGVLATISLQAVINLAVVTGLGPTKGIALPLLSSGGTGWILTAASLGLVIAMDRTRGRYVAPVAATAAIPEVADDSVAAEIAPVHPAVDLDPDDRRFAPPELLAIQSGQDALSSVITTVESESAVATTLDLEPAAAVEIGIDTGREQLTPAGAAVWPTMDVAPGETGLLFAESASEPAPAAEPEPGAGTPEVIITEKARDWPLTLPPPRISPA